MRRTGCRRRWTLPVMGWLGERLLPFGYFNKMKFRWPIMLVRCGRSVGAAMIGDERHLFFSVLCFVIHLDCKPLSPSHNFLLCWKDEQRSAAVGWPTLYHHHTSSTCEITKRSDRENCILGYLQHRHQYIKWRIPLGKILNSWPRVFWCCQWNW